MQKSPIKGFKKSALLLILCWWSAWVSLSAQNKNLIPNASFEHYKECPDNPVYSFYFLDNWSAYPATDMVGDKLEHTPDFFNSCSERLGVPDNFQGHQPPFHGRSYAGIYVYKEKEFMQIELKEPLEKGKTYCMSMFVSQSQRSVFAVVFMQMLFSKYRDFKVLDDRATKLLPTTEGTEEEPHFLEHRKDWEQVCGSYTAQGGEQYLTIGNFKKDEDLVTKKEYTKGIKNIEYGYYYIDMVSVLESEGGECKCEKPDLDDVLQHAYVEDFKEEYINRPEKIKSGKTYALRDVNFNVGSSALLKDSYEQLELLRLLIKTYPNIIIELSGHTDNTGDDVVNYDLSLDRAKAVYDYLTGKGISPNRLRYKAYSSYLPIATNRTKEGRSLNRRVEFIIRERKK